MGSETMGLKGVTSPVRTAEAAGPVPPTENRLTAEMTRGPFSVRHCVQSRSRNQKDREVSIDATQKH